MNTTEVQVTRAIKASPETIYDVWLDPAAPGGLWHGVPRVIIDCRVGGLFHHAVSHQGREWAHYGRFLRLERGRVIEHTWMSAATRGLESILTATFEPEADATRVTLRHTNLPDDDMGRQHEGGWAWYLDVLAQRFEGASPTR